MARRRDGGGGGPLEPLVVEARHDLSVASCTASSAASRSWSIPNARRKASLTNGPTSPSKAERSPAFAQLMRSIAGFPVMTFPYLREDARETFPYGLLRERLGGVNAYTS